MGGLSWHEPVPHEYLAGKQPQTKLSTVNRCAICVQKQSDDVETRRKQSRQTDCTDNKTISFIEFSRHATTSWNLAFSCCLGFWPLRFAGHVIDEFILGFVFPSHSNRIKLHAPPTCTNDLLPNHQKTNETFKPGTWPLSMTTMNKPQQPPTCWIQVSKSGLLVNVKFIQGEFSNVHERPRCLSWSFIKVRKFTWQCHPAGRQCEMWEVHSETWKVTSCAHKM